MRKVIACIHSHKVGTILLCEVKGKDSLIVRNDELAQYTNPLLQDDLQEIITFLRKILFQSCYSMSITFVPVLSDPLQTDQQQLLFYVPRIVIYCRQDKQKDMKDMKGDYIQKLYSCSRVDWNHSTYEKVSLESIYGFIHSSAKHQAKH